MLHYKSSLGSGLVSPNAVDIAEWPRAITQPTVTTGPSHELLVRGEMFKVQSYRKEAVRVSPWSYPYDTMDN